MSQLSNLNDKIVHLQQEIKSLKTTQILGGDNSRVYRHYVVAYSPELWKYGASYVRKSDYDNPEWLPVPGAKYIVTTMLYPLNDDPFALVGIEKIEVWRSGKLLSWGDYSYSGGYIGQVSQYGDILLIECEKQSNGFRTNVGPRLGTTVLLSMCAPSDLSDNPGQTIRYEYRVWLKSTSMDTYGYIEDNV